MLVDEILETVARDDPVIRSLHSLYRADGTGWVKKVDLSDPLPRVNRTKNIRFATLQTLCAK